MRPSWLCVAVSQNVTVRCVEYAMNPPSFGRAMFEYGALSETGRSKTDGPVDASNSLIVLSDMTKRWSLNQRRLVLSDGVTVTLMCLNQRPSLLSQTRTESSVAVAIQSPCGEYLAAVTQSPWSSVCTRLRVTMFQTEAVSFDAQTSRVGSGEKSTPLT